MLQNKTAKPNKYSIKNTEIRIRLRKPNDTIFIPGSYIEILLTQYKIDATPPGISLILKRKRGTNELIVQSISFNTNPLSLNSKIWTIKEAKTWFASNRQFLLKFSIDLEKITNQKDN